MISATVVTPLIEGEIVLIFASSWFKKPLIRLAKKWGYFLISASLAGFLLFLSPMITANLFKSKTSPNSVVSQANVQKQNFLLSIEKIGLKDAKVIAQVDLENKQEYQQVLKEGIAQAKGSAFPGTGKMIYLFSHSTNYPWFIKDLNALFFKLETLEAGDKIDIEYNGKNFSYYVFDKKVVGVNDLAAIEENLDKDILLLQTCYPPGTFWKRLLIFAKPNKFAEII